MEWGHTYQGVPVSYHPSSHYHCSERVALPGTLEDQSEAVAEGIRIAQCIPPADYVHACGWVEEIDCAGLHHQLQHDGNQKYQFPPFAVDSEV